MSSEEDESSGSASEVEDTLVAGREKRATAGNRLSFLLQHLDDEDVKADLVEEDETDQRDYSAAEDEEEDVDLESSDEDEDDAAKDGEDATLEGEKELKKQERTESKKKRKARELVRIAPLRKKVKIAQPPTQDASSASPAPAPKKKTDRLSLLSLTADTSHQRQSMRATTVASKVTTEARMKENIKRAQKTQAAMKEAQERKAAQAGPKLTQADRMARALEIEKHNSRSLSRWENAEKERIRLQEEKAEAMRNRKLDGPVIRTWSGPVTWFWREGADGPVYARVKYHNIEKSKVDKVEDGHESANGAEEETEATATADQAPSTSEPNVPTITVPDDLNGASSQSQTQAPVAEPTSIKESTVLNHPPDPMAHILPSMPPYHHVPNLDMWSIIQPSSPPPTIPSLPLLSEQAARSLLVLESFPVLDNLGPTSNRRTSSAVTATSAISSILVPESHPHLSAAETKYLAGKMKRSTTSREDLLPPAPSRSTCVITGSSARYKDSKTGLTYKDIRAYKALQRVMAGGCAWSPLLGVWTGIVGEGPLGRVAKGVPEGFWSGDLPVKVSEVKAEGETR